MAPTQSESPEWYRLRGIRVKLHLELQRLAKLRNEAQVLEIKRWLARHKESD